MLKKKAVYLAIIIVAGIWSGILNAPFLWDDEGIIVTNSFVNSLKNLGYLFQKSYFTIFHELSYRPVVSFSHIVDAVIWGKMPFGHHLTNLLIHGINVVLLYTMLRKLYSHNRMLALIAPVLFALHPAHLESLGVVAYRDDILMTCFFLCALNTFIILKQKRTLHVGYYSIFVISIGLSLFAKETALVFLPLIFLFDRLIFRTSKNRIPIYAGVICVYLFYVYIRFYVMDNPDVSNSVSFFSDRIPYIVRPLVCSMLAVVMGLLPVTIILDYHNGLMLFVESVQGFFLIILFLMAYKKLCNTNEARTGIILAVLPLVPVLNLFPLENLFANRYMYLPCVGFSILLSCICRGFFQNQKRKTGYAIIAPVILFSCISLYGQQYFLSKEAFAHKLIADSHENYKALNYLGTIRLDQGNINEAQSYYEKALNVNPHFFEAWYNYAAVLIKQRVYDKAQTAAEKLISLNPRRAEGYRLLGDIMLDQNKMDRAESLYQQALTRNPYDLDARNNLGTVYEAQNKLDKASELYISIIKLNRANDIAWANLGNVAVKRKDYNSAEKCYLTALQVNSSNAMTWYNLGNVYYYQKKGKEAETCYIESSLIDPTFPDPVHNLAVVYISAGNKRAALETFQRYLKLNPHDVEAQNQVSVLQQQ